MRQAPDHRVTRNALTPAASTPPVLTSNPARQHCMVCLNALTRHLQPQVIQARERAQVRAIKGSIGHVEVFQMDGVAISIIERPRPLPGHDTPNPAHNTYTLNYEEPHLCDSVRGRGRMCRARARTPSRGYECLALLGGFNDLVPLSLTEAPLAGHHVSCPSMLFPIYLELTRVHHAGVCTHP